MEALLADEADLVSSEVVAFELLAGVRGVNVRCSPENPFGPCSPTVDLRVDLFASRNFGVGRRLTHD